MIFVVKKSIVKIANFNCRPRGGNVQIISVTGPGGEVGFFFYIFSDFILKKRMRRRGDGV